MFILIPRFFSLLLTRSLIFTGTFCANCPLPLVPLSLSFILLETSTKNTASSIPVVYSCGFTLYFIFVDSPSFTVTSVLLERLTLILLPSILDIADTFSLSVNILLKIHIQKIERANKLNFNFTFENMLSPPILNLSYIPKSNSKINSIFYSFSRFIFL